MVTLLSGLLGLCSSALPSILKYFQDIKDKAHELAILQIQVDLAKAEFTEKLDEAEIKGDTAQLATVYSTYYSGNKYMDALTDSVRPIVTFILLGMYCFMQWQYFGIITSQENVTLEVLEQLFTDEDQALLTICLSFFFGNQYFNRNR
jgi:hypothetical protein